MAISKKARRAQEPKAPDASAFLALIDKGLAKPEDVVAAYEQALNEATAGVTDAERARNVGPNLTQQRPVIDPGEPETSGARMIRLRRYYTFKGTDAQPQQIKSPQEEA